MGLDNFPDYTFTFVVLGDKGVGKSSFLNSFDSNLSLEGRYVKSTMDLNVGLNRVALEVYEEIESISPLFATSHGALIVFDVTNTESFENVKKRYEDYQKEDNASGKLKKQIIIVGNKSDDADRKVTFEQAQDLANQLSSTYIEISSKTGKNVAGIFDVPINNLIDQLKTKKKRPLCAKCTIM